MAGSLSDILAGLQNGVTAINGLTTRFSNLFGSSLSSSGSIDSIDAALSSMSGQLAAMSVTLSSISATQASMSTTLSSMSASVGTIAGLSQLKLPYGQFKVYLSSDSSAATTTYNQIRFNTESLDSDGLFTTSNSRYQPTRSGWYYIYVAASSPLAAGWYDQAQAAVYKDGVQYALGSYAPPSSWAANTYSVCGALVNLNGSSNYVEGFSYVPAGSSIIRGGEEATYMMGWRVA